MARRRWRRLARALGLAVLVTVAAALAIVDAALLGLHTSWAGERVRRAVVERVNRTIAGRLDVARLRFGPGHLMIDGLRLDAPSGERVAEMGSVDLRWVPWQLIRRNVVLTSLAIVDPQLALRRGPDGRSNLEQALAARTPAPPTPAAPAGHARPAWSLTLQALQLSGGQLGLVDQQTGGAPRTIRIEQLRVAGSAGWAAGTGEARLALDVQARASAPTPVPLRVRVDARATVPAGLARAEAGLEASVADSEIRLWATADPAVEGTVGAPYELRVDLERLALGPTLVRRLVPGWPVRLPVEGQGSGRWNSETGQVSAKLDLGAGRARLALSALGDVKVRALEELGLHVQGVDLAELIADGPPSDIALDVQANAQALAQGGWNGAGTLDVAAGRVAGRALGPTHARVELDGHRVRLRTLEARWPGLRIAANGEASPDRLALRAEVVLRDLAAVVASVDPHARVGGERGRGRLQLALAGTPARPTLRVSGALTDLAWGPARIAALQLALAVPDLRRPLAADLDVTVPAGQIGDRRLRGLVLRLHGSGARFDGSLALAEPAAVGLSAWGIWDRGHRVLNLHRFTVDLDGTRWALQGPARLLAEGQRTRVQGLRLAGQGGQSARLDLDREGDRIDASVGMGGLALERLPRALLPRGPRLAGRLTAAVELHRRPGRDQVDARATLAHVRVDDLDETSLVAEAHLRDHRLAGTIDGHAGRAQVAARFELPAAWPPPRHAKLVADVTASRVDLGHWRDKLEHWRRAWRSRSGPALPALDGRADLHVSLDGSAARPSLMVTANGRELRWKGIGVGDLAVNVQADGPAACRVVVALTPPPGDAGLGQAELELGVERSLAELLRAPRTVTALQALPLHLRVRLQRLGLHGLALASGAARPLGGWVSGSAALDGTIAHPAGKIGLVLDGVTARGMPPTDAKLDLDLDARRIRMDGEVTRRGASLLAMHGQLAASLRGELAALADAPISFAATVGPLALRRDAQLVQGLPQRRPVLDATVKGRLEVSGSLRAPRVVADAQATNVRLDDRPAGDVDVSAGYASGEAHATLRATASDGGSLHASGRIHHVLGWSPGARTAGWAAAPIEARLDASRLDAAAATGATPSLRKVAGRIDAHIEVTGTLGDPRPSGRLEWRQGELTIAGLGEYRNLHVLAHGDRDRWNLEELVADGGAGHARIKATGRYDGAAHAYAITSSIALDKLPAYVEGQALADVSLDAKAQAQVAPGHVQAQVDLESARLALRDSKPRHLQSLRLPKDVVLVDEGVPLPGQRAAKPAAQALAPPARAATAPPSVVVVLRGSRDLWVRGKDANVELGLDPGFRVELGAQTQVFGRVVVKRGRVDVLSRRFDLKPDSSIRWNGAPDLPELDLAANYVNESENVGVLATVKGTPGHLQTTLTSADHPELTESQLYTLVVTGRMNLGGGSASSATPAAQAETVLGGLLAGQLQKLVASKLPFDVLTIEGGSTAGSARVEAGKYLTRNFYVGYVGRLGADPLLLQNRNAVHLEYDLGTHWSFQGEYGDAKTGSADMIWSKRY